MNTELSKNLTDSKQAIVYLRVSTEEQVDNFSLETQERICLQEAERRGMKIIQVFKEEGRSAKNISGRPVLIDLLEFCRKNKKNIDALIVYRLDRLSRQTGDFLAIRKRLSEYQIIIVSASEPTGNSPTERFIETMLASFAQMDNDVRSERTKNGLRARFLAGLSSGSVPLGYKNRDGYTIKDPQTWDKVKAAWELMGTGTKTLKEMAALMNEWGIRQQFHGKEHIVRPQAIGRMFRNKYYIGILTSASYPDEIHGQHLPMVSEALFYRVQAVIDGRNTNINVSIARRNIDNVEFPLRRIVKCERCDNPVTGGWSKGKRARYAYYRCQKGCKVPSISADRLNESTIHFLSNITPTKEGLDAFIALLRRTYYQRFTHLQKRKEEADKALGKLREQRQALIQKNLSGVYSDEIFKEQNKLIEDQITTVQMAKDDALVAKYNLEAIIKFMRDKFANLGRTYQMSSLSQLRVLLCSIFPSGMTWSYPGLYNTKISPIYQSIRMFETDSVSFSGPERT
jgi:site-specific DNA recombinase